MGRSVKHFQTAGHMVAKHVGLVAAMRSAETLYVFRASFYKQQAFQARLQHWAWHILTSPAIWGCLRGPWLFSSSLAFILQLSRFIRWSETSLHSNDLMPLAPKHHILRVSEKSSELFLELEAVQLIFVFTVFPGQVSTKTIAPLMNEARLPCCDPFSLYRTFHQ